MDSTEDKFKIKELEDQDAKRDAKRRMAWFSLIGMLLYPVAVIVASYLNLDEASKTIGDMAPTYYIAVAAIVTAFYTVEAYQDIKK